jgi:hypothetical protein
VRGADSSSDESGFLEATIPPGGLNGGVNAFGVEGAGIDCDAIADGASGAICIGGGAICAGDTCVGPAGFASGGLDICIVPFNEGGSDGALGESGGIETGIGSGEGTPLNEAPTTTALGPGARSGARYAVVTSGLRSSGIAIGSVLGVDGRTMVAAISEAGGADDTGGAITGGAIEGARGASGAELGRGGTIDAPAFFAGNVGAMAAEPALDAIVTAASVTGASLMRFVIGPALIGGSTDTRSTRSARSTEARSCAIVWSNDRISSGDIPCAVVSSSPLIANGGT